MWWRHATCNSLKIRQQRLRHLKQPHRALERRVEAEFFGGPTLIVHSQSDGASDVVEAACGLGGELCGDESDALVERASSLGYIDAGYIDAVDVVLDGMSGGRGWWDRC
jgi:hypothetical protein